MIDRRQFLKWSGLMAAATTFGRAKGPLDAAVVGVEDHPLRDHADRIVTLRGQRFRLGISLEGGDWNDPSGVPRQLAATEFNHFVNHAIWMPTTYTGPNQWDFSSPDWVLQQSQAAGQSVIGMHLVYGSWAQAIHAVPDWILNGGYTRDQLIAIMESHIVAVLNRYQGAIGAYTVVNEYFNSGGANDWWYQHIGPDYVRIAFQKAREADPAAILIYNDFSNETVSGGNYALTRANVDALKALGLIDAVGLQMHLWSNRPTQTEVLTAMQSYGLPVWVTEFDCFQQASLPDPAAEQAAFTQAMIEAALDSGVVDGFTCWGISDRNSFWNTYYGPGYNPCLWDADNHAKPNYVAVRQTLAAHETLHDAVYLPELSR